MVIALKRIYDDPAKEDGCRVLVDRVWPRGIRKEEARLHTWLKDIAPSSGLRKWFGHTPARWPEFIERYFRELDGHRDLVDLLLQLAGQGRLTLVYGARDREHNNAVALKKYLEQQNR